MLDCSHFTSYFLLIEEDMYTCIFFIVHQPATTYIAISLRPTLVAFCPSQTLLLLLFSPFVPFRASLLYPDFGLYARFLDRHVHSQLSFELCQSYTYLLMFSSIAVVHSSILIY